jgi:hypothetical protein
MDSSVMVAIVMAVIAPTVASILSWIQSSRNSARLEGVKSAQEKAAHQINSRLDEMLKLVGEAERAKGRLEGIDEQKAKEKGN